MDIKKTERPPWITTRKTGHDFDLPTGAIAARGLGGSLTARSDGPGLGATFALELPFRQKDPAGANP